MRRPSLSTKLLAAAVPLLLAIGALLFVTVRNDLDQVNDAERSAQLGAIWSPMIDALAAVDAERNLAAEMANAAASDEPDTDTVALAPAAELAAARTATDAAIATVRTDIEALGENVAAVKHITTARSALSTGRRNLDMAAANMVVNSEPLAAYSLASAELVAVAGLLPPAAGDPVLGRQLLAVEKIAEANLAAGQVIQGANQYNADSANTNALVAARNSLDQLEGALSEFEVIAPEEWASQFRRSGMTIGFASFRIDVDRALRNTDPSAVEPIDVEAFKTLITEGNNFQREISTSIVDQAQTEAADTRSAALLRLGIILGAVVLAMVVTWWITRSIAKRVRAVAKAANQVATRQLPTLVHAMRDPKGRALPTIDPVNTKGSDEVAELAESFNTMQRTLVHVAEEQRAVLRKGVSDIFINMARRNRSLVDRQLSMLDGFEAEVHDPDVLANYYQLDHLATRMRRNAESLLVLANEEPRRRRTGPTDVDNVVRASIGEIEEYRRIQVEHLDNMKVKGNVVADIAHLFAELLDNAAAFSPPNSTVRVGGRRTPDGYTVRINDAGVGINADRLEELNELLRNPPIVGLSVEPTLGMSVVSLLAAKHGIKVTLQAGSPGLTVDVELPDSLSADAPTAMESGPGAGAEPGVVVAAAAVATAAASASSATSASSASGSNGLRIDDDAAVVSATSSGSNGLRIDDAALAQFANGQGLELTSASVNNLSPNDASNPAPAALAAVASADSGDSDDDSTFVMPDTFGTDSYAVTIEAAPAGAPTTDVSMFTMPSASAAVGTNDSMFTMPSAGDYGSNTGTGTNDSMFTMPTVGADGSTPSEYSATTAAGANDSMFTMPNAGDQDSTTGDYGTTPSEYSSTPSGYSAPAASSGTNDSMFTMPTVGDDGSTPSEYRSTADEYNATTAGASNDSMFTMPSAGGHDSAASEYSSTAADAHGTPSPLVAAHEPAQPAAPDEPMFRRTPLDFGVNREPVEASATDFDTQLDRPNISARLTDAFQRSNLSQSHNPAAVAATAAAASAASSAVTTSSQRAEDAPLYVDASFAFEAPTATSAGSTMLPPPPSARPLGEFSRPLSPPASASGPTSQPVTPADAHPAPRIVTRPPTSAPLPTRRAAEVDGGPDRLADLPSTRTANGVPIDEEAGALAAALEAFDRRLDNHHASNGNGNGYGYAPQPVDAASLPTRTRAAVTTPMSNYDDRPESTTTSKLDPEQLRERLRSFQTAVHTAIATAPETTLDAESELGDNR